MRFCTFLFCCHGSRGAHAKARRCEVPKMTGPDLVIDAARGTPEESVSQIMGALHTMGRL